MDALAENFQPHDVGSIFLYTHEAHPGEHYPHLTSMAQKFEHARALKEILGVRRSILVDALDGACHRAYGSMPNMTWIFLRSGVPVYKSDWSDVLSVENALRYLAGVSQRRELGMRMAPFRVERLDFRVQDREAFYHGLERNGPSAVEQYRRSIG
jgi:hypothetical protein